MSRILAVKSRPDMVETEMVKVRGVGRIREDLTERERFDSLYRKRNQTSRTLFC